MYTLVEGPSNNHFTHDSDNYEVLCKEGETNYEVTQHKRQADSKETDNIYAGINPVFSDNQEGSYAPLNNQKASHQGQPVTNETDNIYAGINPVFAESQEGSHVPLNQQVSDKHNNNNATQQRQADGNIYAGINPAFSNNQEGSYAPLNLPRNGNVQQNPIYTESKPKQVEEPYAALSQRSPQQDIYTGLNDGANQNAPLMTGDNNNDSNGIYSELEQDSADIRDGNQRPDNDSNGIHSELKQDSGLNTREQPKPVESMYDNPPEITFSDNIINDGNESTYAELESNSNSYAALQSVNSQDTYEAIGCRT